MEYFIAPVIASIAVHLTGIRPYFKKNKLTDGEYSSIISFEQFVVCLDNHALSCLTRYVVWLGLWFARFSTLMILSHHSCLQQLIIKLGMYCKRMRNFFFPLRFKCTFLVNFLTEHIHKTKTPCTGKENDEKLTGSG